MPRGGVGDAAAIMARFNRDSFVAVILLVACGVLFWASFDIRNPDYGVLPPSTWPRVIVGLLSVLSLIYLVQSLKAGPDEAGPTTGMSLGERFAYWRNPLVCFAMFGLFGPLIVWIWVLTGLA